MLGETQWIVQTHMYVCMHICICIYIYTCKYIYIYIYRNIYLCLCISIPCRKRSCGWCRHICMYVYIYTYTYIYIYIYINIYSCLYISIPCRERSSGWCIWSPFRQLAGPAPAFPCDPEQFCRPPRPRRRRCAQNQGAGAHRQAPFQRATRFRACPRAT